MPKNVRLTIGDFSKYCQVTVKALRHYEKLGLLEPNEVELSVELGFFSNN